MSKERLPGSSPVQHSQDCRRLRRLSFVLALMLLIVALPANSANTADKKKKAAEIRSKVDQIEKKREKVHKKVRDARRKERIAFSHLRKVKREYYKTQRNLKSKKRRMQNAQHEISKLNTTLSQTQALTEAQARAAGDRIREIYEGHRLSFLEMIFQADSLQGLLDRIYYQERIAEQDKKLLDGLRARARALKEHRHRLDQERSKLGDLVSEFSKKALEIAKLKGSKEQTARKLSKQRRFYEQAEKDLMRQSKALETQIMAMEGKSSKNSAMKKGTGKLAMPLKARITSPFGWRRHPIFRKRRFHTGVDLAGPRRSPIRASDSGHVLYTGWRGGYGKVVIISHGNNVSTLYAHLTKIAVKKGSNVSKGDVIGYEGSTGFATGPHLHFEVRIKGKPRNPLKYVK